MKVLEGSYFQKEPPPLVPRYSNFLSDIRELFVTRTPSRQIPVDRLKVVRHGQTNQYTPTAIYLLKVITVMTEKLSYDYLHCCVD